MKQMLLFIMLSISILGMQAQPNHSFVESGKYWKVHGFSFGGTHTVTYYYFTTEKTSINNGYEYYQMFAKTDGNERKVVGLFREEGGCVYLYDEGFNKEYKVYDFTLQEGDEFIAEYDNLSPIKCKVIKTGTITCNGEVLKTITLLTDDGLITREWIEGVGTMQGPLVDWTDAPGSWSYRAAYVLSFDNIFLPFSFDVPYSAYACHGQQLNLLKKASSNDLVDSLNYEFVFDPTTENYTLHVYGRQVVEVGPNHYVYCFDETTADATVHKLTFKIEDVDPYLDRSEVYNVDYYIPHFEDYTYIITDAQGEHMISAKKSTDDNDYRPFIEENKVWHVGYFPGASSIATRGNTYYFDGDTIVGGEICKRWMCNGNLIAPIYERDGQVWLFPKGEETPQLIYNFNVQEGDEFSIYWIDNKKTGTCTVKSVREAYSQDYPLRTVTIYDSFTLEQLAQAGYDKEKDPEEYDAVLNSSCLEWIEGIGSCVRLEDNIGIGGRVGYYYSLVDVKIGDEIIFKNPSLTWDYDAIHSPQSSTINHNSYNHQYYDLSGRRLATPPTRRGVYVNGSRKILIK